MDYEELLEYLDLEDPSQFEYFEAMADIIECDEYIENGAVYRLFDGADKTMIAELLSDYFEDITEGLSDNSGTILTLLEQIKMSLVGMVSNTEDEDDLRKFTDEFCRFINWYSHESETELLPENGGSPEYYTLRDAITASRMEKLGGEKYRYNFEPAMDYELDSYVMSFADLISAQEQENEGRIVFTPEDEPKGMMN